MAYKLVPGRVFQENLLALYQAQPLSASAWAELHGLDQSVMSRYLHGKLDPSTEMVQRIATKLGIDAWRLLAPNLGREAPIEELRYSARALNLAAQWDKISDEMLKGKLYREWLSRCQLAIAGQHPPEWPPKSPGGHEPGEPPAQRRATSRPAKPRRLIG